VARALAAALAVSLLAVSLLAVSGAGGAGAQTPKRGGTVVIGVPSTEIACLNLLYAPCQFDAPFVLGQTLEGAFDADYSDLTYRPNLVSRVTFTRNPPFTLTYHIRPKARWSDGAPVTAADFVFTYQVSSREGVDPSWIGDFEPIRSVRAVDAKTLRVVLRTRFAAWRELFPFVLPRHVLVGQDLTAIWRDGIDDPKTGRPIGSGPFLVRSIEGHGRDVVYVRNPAYWGTHEAHLDRLIVRGFPDEDPAEALLRGEVDIVPGAAQLRGAPGITVITVPNTLLEHLTIRIGAGGHPALGSKLVRRALAYGIDRGAIVRSAPRGARLLDNVVFFTNSVFYVPNWAGYRYRPTEARRLLELAGCQPEADGVYSCGGERLSLRFVTTAGNPVRQAVLDLAQTQLRRVGIEVRPSYAPASVLFGQILPSGDFHVALVRSIFAPDPGGRVDIYGCGKGSNVTGYCSRLVTRDLDESTRIFDAKLRAALLNRVDRQLSRAVPVLPLYQAPGTFAFNGALRGVTEDFVWKSENWWLAR